MVDCSVQARPRALAGGVATKQRYSHSAQVPSVPSKAAAADPLAPQDLALNIMAWADAVLDEIERLKWADKRKKHVQRRHHAAVRSRPKDAHVAVSAAQRASPKGSFGRRQQRSSSASKSAAAIRGKGAASLEPSFLERLHRVELAGDIASSDVPLGHAPARPLLRIDQARRMPVPQPQPAHRAPALVA